MLIEFEKEENGRNPYRSSRLNSTGKKKFRKIMEDVINLGHIDSLTHNLSDPFLWNQTELYRRGDTTYDRKIDPNHAAKSLAHTEFTTWYTRGFARRLIEENIDSCEIYRAGEAQAPRCECTQLEGEIVKVKKIYDGHRTKYHPNQNPKAFSIPSGPYCHHTIRRIKTK